ncbi:hypothetical protein WCLP8_860004 [uncultured Gammaproteobacteria bacterium]
MLLVRMPWQLVAEEGEGEEECVLLSLPLPLPHHQSLLAVEIAVEAVPVLAAAAHFQSRG